MKIYFYVSFFILPFLCLGYLSAHDEPTQNVLSDYDLMLVTLEQSKVNVMRCPLQEGLMQAQLIFTLDILDIHESYNTVLCDSETNGFIIVRSAHRAMSDYCLNWGAMVGVDISAQNIHSFVPATIEQVGDNTCIKSLVQSDGVSREIQVECAEPVKSACAFIVKSSLVNEMSVGSKKISFVDGCRMGIVTIKTQDTGFPDPSLEQEIEFERVIDSMVQDGTIKIKPVSPCMAWLRGVGSSLFVKYLAVKNALKFWWGSRHS